MPAAARDMGPGFGPAAIPLNGRRALRLAVLRLVGQLRRPPARPPQPRRILVIRPDHMGDLIMASPALAALRQAFPEAHLTAWVGPWGEPVWRGNPNLDAIEVCRFPGFTRVPKGGLGAPYQLAFKEARRLAGRFDLAINLRCDFWWGAMAACWAGIPVAGHDVAECRPFLSLAVPYDGQLHEVDQNLALAAAAGGDSALSSRHPALADWWHDSAPGTEPPAPAPDGAIAIHAGAGAAVKLWCEERWAAVADALAPEAAVLFVAGSEEERDTAEHIRALMSQPAVVVSGLTIEQLAGLQRRCRLVLGVDNGPLHLAEALGRPTVALFGPADPAKFGPYPGSQGVHEVVRLPWRCIPCGRLDYTQDELRYHLCVRLIDPTRVVQAARRALQPRQP
ncbi:MAG: glycosyltransferase family 9 protein [Chloroflexota bacterium]|nr:glycosyltransferase family 9 protein [Chloroflexota bacterium]